MQPKRQLYIVEDDKPLSSLMKDFFENEEFQVTCLHSGQGASNAIINGQPDAVLLDLDLPDTDGLEVCRKARKKYKKPIIMLTGNDSDYIEISSLNVGADKFMRKPVKLPVLYANVIAMLRWETAYIGEHDEPILQTTAKDIILNENTMSLELNGQRTDLSYNEMSILSLLFKRQGQCVSREELHQEVRGFEYDGLDRTIDLKVSSLRKKLNDEQAPYKYIKTIRGKGYLLYSPR